MNLDFDDEARTALAMRTWHGRTYTTNVIIMHTGDARSAKLQIKVSSWEPSGRTVDSESMDISEEASRDPLEQLRLGAVLFELWCIKKGVNSETQNQ